MAEQQQPRRGASAIISPPSSGGAAAAAAELDLPGFRFHPTEEELLEFYLKQVAHGRKLKFDIIPTVQLYRHDPWELPGLARIGEREWYFFVPRDGGSGRAAKQHHQSGSGSGGGGRPSRTTERGFWKATGSDRAVRCAADPKRLIGLKKTLVYYEGRAPRGTKTDWVMNEYRLPDAATCCNNNNAAGDSSAASSTNKSPKEDIVLCKIYRKAVSLKELEQRVAMEELARATAAATPSASASHNTGSPADSMSSSDQEAAALMRPAATMMHVGISPPPPPPVMMSMKKEEVVEPAAAAVLMKPATLSLPQLEVVKQQQEWMQDPFLTQLRSPWMESWSPYYASVLNF